MNDLDACMPDIVQLESFGAAFGERVILSDVTLSIPEKGVFTLLGPGGTGKSTLLRSLVGLNDANPSFRTWGSAYYQGEALSGSNRPALVSQSAKLMMSSVFENIVHNLPERNNLDQNQQKDLAVRLLEEAGIGYLVNNLNDSAMTLPLPQQRHLAILRLAASGARLLCLDEPTSGIDNNDAELLLDYVNHEAKRRAILIVLHNLSQARKLTGYIALLAGGHIQEIQSTDGFIDAPKSIPAKQWVKLGSCNVPSPDACPEDLAEDVIPPPPLPEAAKKIVNSSFGPRGFLWLKRGLLAGTPLPGVFHDIDYDLMALKKVGVDVLLNLTRKPQDDEVLNKHDIRSIWEPVKDMGAPTIDQAILICETIESVIKNNEVIAVHCRAGLGRTGTILAAFLIWEGTSALDALDTVRGVEPRWVQSDEQVVFLEEFAKKMDEDFPGRCTCEVDDAKQNDKVSYV